MTSRGLASWEAGAETDRVRVVVVGDEPTLARVPAVFSGAPGLPAEVRVDSSAPEEFGAYLESVRAGHLAVVFFLTDGPGIPSALRALRDRRHFDRTRVYLLTPDAGEVTPETIDTCDVEEAIGRRHLTLPMLAQMVANGVRAYRALGANPLVPRNYLDAQWNEVFDWFETTKWDWREVDLSRIEKERLSDDDVEMLHELAIGEFGTLPAAHNFLREWHDEYSFSSWTLSWGAEEARHALVQSRYLRAVGVELKAKHAMYKREPYPMGRHRAGTLMMNIISETRASEYYSALARRVSEPVLRRIWTLLGRDEARHARAFAVFCKELTDRSDEDRRAALEMAYVWLADRSRGIKHPAGFFYPHSTTTRGFRRIEGDLPRITDHADQKILAIIRKMLRDDSLQSVADVKAQLRVQLA